MQNSHEQVAKYLVQKLANEEGGEELVSPKDMHRALVKYFQEGLMARGYYHDELAEVNLAKEKFDKYGDRSSLAELYRKYIGSDKTNKIGKNIDIKV